jgi:hypothetical protein
MRCRFLFSVLLIEFLAFFIVEYFNLADGKGIFFRKEKNSFFLYMHIYTKQKTEDNVMRIRTISYLILLAMEVSFKLYIN